MLKVKTDDLEFELKESFDFSFLSQYGKVFQVFDEQDSGNICFGTMKGNQKYFIKVAGPKTKNYQGNVLDSIEKLKATISIYVELKPPSLIQLLDYQDMKMVFMWYLSGSKDFQWGECIKMSIIYL